MKRREFLKYSGGVSLQAALGGALLKSWNAHADPALDWANLTQTLAREIPASDVIAPTSALYHEYNKSFNTRTLIAPQIRVIADSPQSVVQTVAFAKASNIQFATRGGGHSYEGFSQSPSLVIDLRKFDNIQVDKTNKLLHVGAGAKLGEVYAASTAAGLVFPAGSCFTVGAAGHSLGGGFGLLSRPMGLACDNIVAMTMVDANAKVVEVNAQSSPELFWALRGGGNGNFGIVTQFTFRAHPIGDITKFTMNWVATIDQGVKLVQAYQAWLPQLHNSVTCTFHLRKISSASVGISIAGISTEDSSIVNAELARLQRQGGRARQGAVKTMAFMDAARLFNGNPSDQPLYMKAKSDYIDADKPLSDTGIRVLLQSLTAQEIPIAVMLDSYGGAINQVPTDPSVAGSAAFVHRDKTAYSFQYYTEWTDPTPAVRDQHLAAIRSVYNPVRPYVSGRAYVNYCDLDLGAHYASAYWGKNLPHLMELKAKYDPANLFTHVQGVPMAAKV